MRVVGVIQARNGSKRLPGKSIAPLAGKPLLYRFIERVKKAERLDEIVLATTLKPEDNCLIEIADELDIGWFRGSENDLVDRIYNCAIEYKADAIVRLCADNPLIEPNEIDRIVDCYTESAQTDKLFTLFSNTQDIDGSGYPDGLGAEVYSMELFECLFENIEDSYMREHPHEYFYRNDLVRTCQCPEELKHPHTKVDVNTLEEYEYVKAIYDKFGPDCHFTDYIDSISKRMVASG